MTAPIDYSAVLADLEARRTGYVTALGQIDAAIAVIRALVGSSENGDGMPFVSPPVDGEPPANGTAPIGNGTRPGAGVTLDRNAFFRMSTAGAMRKYLDMMKRPQTARAIADALHDGGQVHAADRETAYKNVASALRRNAEFTQNPRTKEWALNEWYEAGKASE